MIPLLACIDGGLCALVILGVTVLTGGGAVAVKKSKKCRKAKAEKKS